MSIKEMPLEEKYDQLFDFCIKEVAKNYAFNKEQGTLDEWLDYSLKVEKKMMPSLMVAPGRTFKQFVDQDMYASQSMIPLSNIELSWVSDREAVMRIKNCEVLRRSRDIVKKAGLNIDPKFFCQMEQAMWISPEQPMKEYGIDWTCELEENGCKWTIKLK